ncbi:MAG: hypothetical protein HOO06_01140 [Bdellovibrionaceae bacterium]|nr:hypothetical protein [Pseudobdellovibrionaceae bacterium]
MVIKIYLFVLSLFLVQPLLASDDFLQFSCDKNAGELVSELVCPNSGEKRKGSFCIVENSFYNGCTASVTGYGELFFDSCVLHDHCYHHEPASNGKSKNDCDIAFYENLKQVCKTTFWKKACDKVAKSSYKALKAFGESSWSCSNTQSQYSTELPTIPTTEDLISEATIL